jgi:beta-1,2-mannobiose phosphorylase / 1,2-beta-oligomannan phosphorylase
LVIDWLADDVVELVDPRVVKRKADGLVRLTFISHIRVAKCGDGRAVSEITDVHFSPATSLEEFGVEDPRITAIEGRYFFTYVAVSRHGAATALASTADFRTFDRHGVVFCPENKDVVLFPERIGGQYAALHRPNAATPFCRPEMWVARSPDLIHWGQHDRLHGGGGGWETGRVGAGTPPVRAANGWLEIYHGNRQPTKAGEVGTYATGVLLLDPQNPAKILSRTSDSIFEPTADFERHGFVPDVVFPTGIVEKDGSYLIYYGAADSCTAVVEFSKKELLESLS